MLGVYLLLTVSIGQAITWIGRTRLNGWAHDLYLLVTRSPLNQKNVRRIKAQILKTKLEFQSTSSQDEFAKWARLRRKLDKEVAELENLNKEIGTARTQFSALFTTVLWIFTTGLQFVLVSWHRKTPVFFLPTQWFPPAVVWLLGFPSAPYGAVSTTVWAMVCGRAFAMMSSLISDSLGLLMGPQSPSPHAASATSEASAKKSD